MTTDSVVYIVVAQQLGADLLSLSDYYTANEAARILKVHPETVKRLCRQGDLAADKLHNTWLIRRDFLEVFAGTYNSSPGARRRLL